MSDMVRESFCLCLNRGTRFCVTTVRPRDATLSEDSQVEQMVMNADGMNDSDGSRLFDTKKAEL